MASRPVDKVHFSICLSAETGCFSLDFSLVMKCVCLTRSNEYLGCYLVKKSRLALVFIENVFSPCGKGRMPIIVIHENNFGGCPVAR